MFIIKASLNFASKFWSAMVCTWIYPTCPDNTLMPNHTVFVANIVAGYEIVLTRCIVKEIHK